MCAASRACWTFVCLAPVTFYGKRGTSIFPNGRLQSLQIFLRFPDYWRAPICPNFKMREVPIHPYLGLFFVKSAYLIFFVLKQLSTLKRYEKSIYIIFGMYFFFLRGKNAFLYQIENKNWQNRLILPYFCLEYPTKGVVTCRFVFK